MKIQKNKKSTLYNIFIIGFIILYAITAFISFFHCIQFCLVGNVMWVALLLSGAFEIGQSLCLASILLTDNKKTTVPWVLMSLLTAVQVSGNVFSVYKYMVESGSNFYIYIQKSLLFWIQGISPDMILVVVAWILGALLPIIALLMTHMVSNNLKLKEKIKEEETKSFEEEVIKNNTETLDSSIGLNTEEELKEISYSSPKLNQTIDNNPIEAYADI